MYIFMYIYTCMQITYMYMYVSIDIYIHIYMHTYHLKVLVEHHKLCQKCGHITCSPARLFGFQPLIEILGVLQFVFRVFQCDSSSDLSCSSRFQVDLLKGQFTPNSAASVALTLYAYTHVHIYIFIYIYIYIYMCVCIYI